jgi:hypothetical protein
MKDQMIKSLMNSLSKNNITDDGDEKAEFLAEELINKAEFVNQTA